MCLFLNLFSTTKSSSELSLGLFLRFDFFPDSLVASRWSSNLSTPSSKGVSGDDETESLFCKRALLLSCNMVERARQDNIGNGLPFSESLNCTGPVEGL